MHNAAFRHLSLSSWHYESLPLAPDELAQRFSALKHEGFVGLNVTLPHKQRLLSWLTLDESARAVGAVNTVCLRRGIGYNTDADGFLDDLREKGVEIRGKRALLLGAGGAARAVAWGLAREGACLGIWNRSSASIQSLQGSLHCSLKPLQWEEVLAWKPELIVQCTPVGMWPETDACVWPDSLPFPSGCTLVDLVYRPARTKLMERAEQAGSRAIGGLGMLVHQGARAFEIWTGKTAPTDVMRAAALRALET
jgi:shikimate dehydrogenase